MLGVGAASRLFRLGDWSLWFDEETSIYFALNPGKPFPRAFPLYFWVLGRVLAATGGSIYAARLISVLVGIATLWLAWRCIRRVAGDEVALPALVLLVLSPGHLFWSQSVRYYMLVLAFQIASIHAFLCAMERPSILSWVLTIGWLGVALLTNTTAALLLPVYVIALAWTLVSRSLERVVWRTALVIGVAVIALSLVALTTLLSLHAQFGDGSVHFGWGLLLRFIGYAGPPAVALMLSGLILAWQPSTAFTFFVLLAIVPVLELMALRTTGLWSIAWYHAIVALVGVAAMAGYGWKALAERLPRWSLASTGAGVLVASLVPVVSYFTTAHGDRPRWREAAELLRQRGIVATTTDVDVFSPAPGVIAYYLGVPPAETMGHPLVRLPPWSVMSKGPTRESWFVLEQRIVPPAGHQWLGQFCQSRGTFPAFLVTRDRTVVVYRCLPR